MNLVGIPDSSQVQSPPEARPKKTLGRDDFLRLLITQLEHQDPLNPLEGTEFTAQLARFSSLDQLFQIQERLSEMTDSQELGIRVQALGLMGQEVVAQGNRVLLPSDGEATLRVQLAQPASQVRLLILNEQGESIRQVEVGALEGGVHLLTWDGRDQEGHRMPPGTYRYEVVALNAAGEEIQVQTYVTGRVQGVRFEPEGPVLDVEGMSIPLRFIQEVRTRIP